MIVESRSHTQIDLVFSYDIMLAVPVLQLNASQINE